MMASMLLGLCMLQMTHAQECPSSWSKPGCEDAALLQFQKQFQGQSAVCTPTELAQLNSGECDGDPTDCRCVPNAAPGGSEVLGPFPTGQLNCSAQTSCFWNPGTGDATKFFDLSAGAMTCAGKISCQKRWNVENVGAVCCTADNSCDQSLMKLTDVYGKNDVCCTGSATCQQGHFENVRSFACNRPGIKEQNTCNQAYAEIWKDFYCSTIQGCGQQLGDDDGEEWKFMNDGSASSHCVTCDSTGGSGNDNGACQQAQFQFPAEANVQMNCEGFKPCQGAEVNLAGNAKVQLDCNGDKACQGVTVNLADSACVEIVCEGPAVSKEQDKPCHNLEVAGGGACICTGTYADQCPDECDSSGSCELPAISCPGEFCCRDTGECAGTCVPIPDPPPPSTSGGGAGDPHIHSLHGAHYTLLKQGTFLAWDLLENTTFLTPAGQKKGQVHWQLFTHYAGRGFRTHGFLLVSNAGQILEYTSNDCVLRSKMGDSPWKPVSSKSFLGDNVSGFDVVAARKKNFSKKLLLETEIILKKNTEQGFAKVARFFTHCRPGDFMNFKMVMKQSDIDSVGGELGVQPEAVQKSSGMQLLSSSIMRSMRLRTDEEFEAVKTWVELGGSEDADAYFKKFRGSALAQVPPPCSESDEEEAVKICAKYLSTETIVQSQVFVDCVFDVCHGGGEMDAELTAALIAA